MVRKILSTILLSVIILWETSPLAHAYLTQPIVLTSYNQVSVIHSVFNNKVSEIIKKNNDKKEQARIIKNTKKVTIIKKTVLKNSIVKQTTEVVKEVDEARIQTKGWAKGQCTEYVAQRIAVTWRGNAGQWLKNAQKQGIPTGDKPFIGAILVTNEGRVGHVAIVTKVYEDGVTFEIKEQNYLGKWIISKRTLKSTDRVVKGFIYP